MKKLQSKSGAIFAGIYLCVSAVALGFMLYLLIFDPAHSEFSGLYLVILTLPWSGLSVRIIDYFGIMDTFGLVIPLSTLLLCVTINTVILYWIGRGIDGLKTK